ncbi:MAG: PDZ domain-containing protein [bacterium]
MTIIDQVIDGSEAMKAGLEPHDIVIAIDGEPLKDFHDLSRAIKEREGRPIKLSVQRDNQPRSIELKPAWNPENKTWLGGIVFHETLPDFFDKESENPNEPLTINFELLDARGETVNARITLGSQEEQPYSKVSFKEGQFEKLDTDRKRELLSYVVSQVVDGKTIEADLIKLVNSTGGKAFWAPDLENASGIAFGNSIYIKTPFGQLGPHVIAHEFRHLWQETESSFYEIKQYYHAVTGTRYKNDAAWAIQDLKGLTQLREILESKFDAREVDQIIAPFIRKTLATLSEYNDALDEYEIVLTELLKKEKSRDFAFAEKYDSPAREAFNPLLDSKKLEAFKEALKNPVHPDFDIKIARNQLIKVDAIWNNRPIDEHTNDSDVKELVRRISRSFSTEWLKAPRTAFNWARARLDGDNMILENMAEKFSIKIPLREGAAQEFELAKSKLLPPENEATSDIDKKISELKLTLDERRKKKESILAGLPKADTPVIGTATVRDILRLPTFWVERDAEYGALVTLRTLKKETGIDLFTKTPHEDLSQAGTASRENETVLQKLKRNVDSFVAIEHYLKLIGVPNGCLKKLPPKTPA